MLANVILPSMKAVLLAAGRSFRTKPIDDKNFLSFCGKFLIEHQLRALVKAGFVEIMIVGGAHNLERIAEVGLALNKSLKSKHMKIAVVEQENLEDGMAGAVLSAEKWIGEDPFLVVSSNDVIDDSAFELMKKAVQENEKAIKKTMNAKNTKNAGKPVGFLLAKKVTEYFPGGYMKLAKNGVITTLVEKPGEGNEPSDLVNIVVHYHADSKSFFDSLKSKKSQRDDHYEQALQSLFSAGVEYRAVAYNGFWQPIKYPWHVIDVMEFFMPKKGKVVRGKNVVVAKSAVIKGPVFLDDGVKVFENAVISGPAYIGKNSVVATGALVRGSCIGSHCVIGFGSEIARSYIGNDVWTHTNYIGDSVIGNNVSFGSGTVTGNLRLDEGHIGVNVKDEKISSKRSKLGLITGDNIRCGINTSFMPGVRIGSNTVIGAGIVIAQDIPENQFVRGEHMLKISPNRSRIGPREHFSA